MPNSPLQEFIWQHRDDDPRQLALSAKKFPDFPVSEVAAQVQALQKIRAKIPSWYQAGLHFPLTLSLEQASSEQTARFKSSLFSGKKMADLTGGLGIDSYFFSKSFDSVSYVEQGADLCAAAAHNFAQLGVANVQFHNCPAEEFLREARDDFELIYLDPARRDERRNKVFQLTDCSPDVLAIKDLLLERSSRILVKTSPMLDLRMAATQLGSVAKIWVVAAGGECREVLYLLGRELLPLTQISIETISLREAEPLKFNFTWEEEQLAEVAFSAPQKFLYEPNPEILKSGAFRSFARRFGLAKLHAHTHLYTSSSLQADLPARSFVVERVCKYDPKLLKSLILSGKANITSRNFPDTPEQIRRKIGLRDGGEHYLFAATDAQEKKIVMLCRKA